ncbi:hypothetical protein, partial [Enterococcus gallinarum]|uniref:hypothetical protein n=1 Tax=Enterococcus gallinarum TaxID=1353 RepID=UPI00142C5BF6
KRISDFKSNLHFRWPFSYILSWPFTLDSSNSSKIKAIIDRLSLSKMVILITHDTNIVENAVAKFSIKEKQIYQMN